MLLLGAGHCFRDHVFEVCPEFARFSNDAEGIRKSFEGFSLETIKPHGRLRHGPDAGAGRACRLRARSGRQGPTAPWPGRCWLRCATCRSLATRTRRVVLAWRRSFTRYEAIAALRNAVYACELPGVQACPHEPRTMNPALPPLPAPSRWALYLNLIRWDRPAGWLLLLWPSLSALWLAPVAGRLAPGGHLCGRYHPDAQRGLLHQRFVADRDFDRHVKRTAHRPGHSGHRVGQRGVGCGRGAGAGVVWAGADHQHHRGVVVGARLAGGR